MIKDNITEGNWKIHKNIQYKYNAVAGISIPEQETIINEYNQEENTTKKKIIQVITTDPSKISKLFKSEYFTLKEVLLSKHKKTENKILEIKGTIETKGITIRMKKPIFTKETIEKRKIQGKINMQNIHRMKI